MQGLCAGHDTLSLLSAKIRLMPRSFRTNFCCAPVSSGNCLLESIRYLPLGQRIALKVMQILREEMNAIGGQEFYLPALHPAEIWQESGRWDAIGDEMFRLKDRKGTDMCLGMTHEEVFTTIARNELRSYKQLPQVWYQIQIKFRDEARPKSGLMRVRTFIMKDAYTFDVDQRRTG